jgi:hypothetical protein
MNNSWTFVVIRVRNIQTYNYHVITHEFDRSAAAGFMVYEILGIKE